MNRPRLHSFLYFLLWTAAVVFGGATAGAVSFALGGAFLQGHHWLRDAASGARHLGFIALIWAPGIALVATVMRAHRARRTD